MDTPMDTRAPAVRVKGSRRYERRAGLVEKIQPRELMIEESAENAETV